MEEKTLIEGKSDGTAKTILLIIGIVLIAVAAALYMTNFQGTKYWHSAGGSVTVQGYEFQYDGQTYTRPFLGHIIFEGSPIVAVLLDAGLALAVAGIIVLVANIKTRITVTDRRVFGNASFGKNVDVPITSVSTVTTGGLKGISFGTASGKTNFMCIKNNQEIQKIVSGLLVKNNSENMTAQKNEKEQNVDLKKLKEYLDEGIISEKEFNEKKRQILGL